MEKMWISTNIMKQWAEAELQGSLAQCLPGQTPGSTGPALEHPGLDGGGWRRGRREEAGLKEGLFGCSTQWVPCWKEVWTQFVSVVNLITASMRGWSHREQVPLTAEPWSKPCSPRRRPCASCSLFSPLHVVSLLSHFWLLFFKILFYFATSAFHFTASFVVIHKSFAAMESWCHKGTPGQFDWPCISWLTFTELSAPSWLLPCCSAPPLLYTPVWINLAKLDLTTLVRTLNICILYMWHLLSLLQAFFCFIFYAHLKVQFIFLNSCCFPSF